MKCEGKEPSESDKFIIDIIGVFRMSMQSFIKLVGIRSKSDDLCGANRTRRRTSLAVTHIGFCKTFLVSGGFSTCKCESQGEEE